MLDNAQCQSGHSLVFDGRSSQSLFSRPLILTFYLDCHPFILANSVKKKISIYKTYIFGYKKSIMI